MESWQGMVKYSQQRSEIMMEQERNELEIFWNGILSENKAEIIESFLSISADEQRHCLNHLRMMVYADGWQAEQRRAAGFALGVLDPDQKKE